MSKNNVKEIVIVGAGGFGKEVLWTLQDCNKVSKKYEILGFVDDDNSLMGKIINNFPVLGDTNWLLSPNKNKIECVIALGDNKTRKKMVKKLEERYLKFPNIIHPSVKYSDFVNIGQGVIIQHGSIISTDVTIGNHVFINFNCTVGHDCKLNDFVTLSHGVNISGTNLIEEGVFIGAGSATDEKIKIGKWSIIGGGIILGKNVPENCMFFGPSGKMKEFQSNL